MVLPKTPIINGNKVHYQVSQELSQEFIILDRPAVYHRYLAVALSK